MQRIYKAARKCGYLQGLLEPLETRDAKKITKNKILYLATGSQGEPMGAMNRIINGVHPEVFMESGDCVIFSSKIIPGNEKKLYSIQNLIVKNNIPDQRKQFELKMNEYLNKGIQTLKQKNIL